MSNLGLHTIYGELNERPDTYCERAFWEPGLGIKSLETGTPLNRFDIVAFSVSFELDYPNIVSMLRAARIPLHSENRTESHPLVVAGGACIMSNPEPIADFVDVFVVGEGEEIVHTFVDSVLDEADREALFRSLAAVPGFYVPRFVRPVFDEDDGPLVAFDAEHGIDLPVRRARNTTPHVAHSCIITPKTVFANTFLVEVSRGCARNCKFCLASRIYPVVNYEPELVEDVIGRMPDTAKKVGLVSAAVSDYPHIDTIVERLVSEGKKLSVSSLRAETVSETLLDGLVRSGQRTITLAPEVGTERLGKAIGKHIPQRRLLDTVARAIDAGLQNVKLYFMLGLPGETEDDVDGIIDLSRQAADIVKHAARNTKRRHRLTVDLTPFVPKPFTAFQNEPMCPAPELRARLKRVRTALQRVPNVKCVGESIRSSTLQCVLARGDRRTGTLLELVARDDLTPHQAIRQWHLNPQLYIQPQHDSLHAWDILSSP